MHSQQVLTPLGVHGRHEYLPQKVLLRSGMLAPSSAGSSRASAAGASGAWRLARKASSDTGAVGLSAKAAEENTRARATATSNMTRFDIANLLFRCPPSFGTERELSSALFLEVRVPHPGEPLPET